MTSQPETLSLSASVFGLGHDEDLVFLDVSRDQYVCLPNVRDVATLLPDRRQIIVRDQDLGSELRSAGLVHDRAPTGGSTRALTFAPQRSALPDDLEPPEPADLAEMARCALDLLLSYRGRSFAEILANAATPLRSTPAEPLEVTVRRFHRWVPYAPVSGKCLLRSFLLLRHLRRFGHDPAWVFGVTTWPFGAHCWLQHEDLVLDDTCDRVAIFRPILVL